jgi:nucleoside-diphosphate-sugar epimerase
MGRRVLITGTSGRLGRQLVAYAPSGVEVLAPSRSELDFLDFSSVGAYLGSMQPEAVIHAAALVGGIDQIQARASEFFEVNLRMQANLIEASKNHRVGQLCFVASSGCYPAGCPSPQREDKLWDGSPDVSLRPYAMAKRAGIEHCATIRREFGLDYFSVLPPNLIGPGREGQPATGVVPMLIERFLSAMPEREVVVWGTGQARREMMDVRDAARAIWHLVGIDAVDRMPWTNLGLGESLSIAEVAATIQRVVGHTGPITFDPIKPEGVLDKCNDCTILLDSGWRPEFTFEESVRSILAQRNV